MNISYVSGKSDVILSAGLYFIHCDEYLNVNSVKLVVIEKNGSSDIISLYL